MDILELAMKDPETLADKDFVEKALAEIENDITYVEQKCQVELVGDRADFNTARREWLQLTKIQVAYQVSAWRSNIQKSYS